MLGVCRQTRLITGYQVTSSYDLASFQAFADGLAPAERYCSDGLLTYQQLIWPNDAPHIVSRGKDETHTIESINANLRTYLGRLARASRCFSRTLQALEEAVRLFIYHHNRRTRFIQRHPQFRHALPLSF